MRRLQERGPVAALSDRDDARLAPTADRPRMGRRRLASAFLIAAMVVALDQVTKSVASAHLHRPVHLVGPLGLALTFNTGTAFSLFTGSATVIVVVAMAVIALLGWVAWQSRTVGLSLALGLILGGALGNLSDRLLRGHHRAVVDFITLTHWPTFNIADAGITVGAILVVVLSFRRAKPAETS